jgi:bifunctional non-homologous end joining protein LigD
VTRAIRPSTWKFIVVKPSIALTLDDEGRVAKEYTTIEAAGHEIKISSPSKVFFTKPKLTKLDLVEYYLAVAGPAVLHLQERPGTMKRFVDGAAGEFFFQKRVPKNAPPWLQTATFTFPSGRSATELVVNDAAHLAWAVNLGVIDFNPHPVRRSDLDCPDELRVDLDPQPRVRFSSVCKVAMVVREVLEAHGLVGWPKTSGSRGIHVNVRIKPDWDYNEVRRAALALAREVERRIPKLATSKWG